MSTPRLLIRGRSHNLDRTLVMGVVNASPESFSDAGRYNSLDDRLALCADLVADGADIIDVGGQSAITNQPELDAALEIERVVPVVEWLATHHPQVLVSVDTYKPPVVEAVLAAGASIINDVSGLAYPQIVGPCARAGAALVIMHTSAPPKVRRQSVELYSDVAHEVVDFLAERMQTAIAGGLPRESVIVDPGPDFTKTPHQTVAVLRRLADVRALDRPVLLALSRKDFLGAILDKPPRQRDTGTLAAIAHLGAEPGTIVRVHDVAATLEVLRTVDVLAGRSDIPPDYLLPDELRHEARPD